MDVPGPCARPEPMHNVEEHARTKKNTPKPKKSLRTLSDEVKKENIRRKITKELQRSLLPDAPPRKRSRNESPPRTPVRLSAGTPTTPPPPVLPWQIRNLQDETRNSSHPEESLPPPEITIESPIERDIELKFVGFSSRCDEAGSSTDMDTTLQDLVAMDRARASSSSSRRPAAKQRAFHVSNLAIDRGAQEASSRVHHILQEGDEEEVQMLDVVLGPEMEDGVAEEEVVPEPTDFTLVSDYMESDSEVWLAQQDLASDRALTILLASSGERLLEDNLTFDWSCDHNTFKGQREVFTGTPGPTFPLDEMTSPLDVYLRFFDDELIDLIVTQTNKNALTLINDSLRRQSRLKKWTDSTRAEIHIFLAILILQGLIPLPVERDYWYGKGYLSFDKFKDIMTYNRFLLLKRLLHFSDDDAVPALNEDERKLRKIWPVLDILNKRFSTLYLPGRDIVIDESLLKWHGRLSFAQKIASKAAKVGIRSYELCESLTGYLWKFFVYTGKANTDGHKEEQTDSQIDGNAYGQTDVQEATSARPQPPPNAISKIVYDLAHPLRGLGHTLVMDNFYNSPLLARYLKSQGMDCFGTLRVNRESVPESVKSVTKTELRVGELAQSFCRDLSVIMWQDTNLVSMISTFHTGEVGEKQKQGRHRYKPQVVLDYNLSMGGVDKKDKLLSAHPIERVRNQVWYKKAFRRLLNVTILNAFVIFKTLRCNKRMQHRTFRLHLAEKVIETYRPRAVDRPITVTPKSIQRPGRYQRPLLVGAHYIGKALTKNGRCALCGLRRSNYRCEECNRVLCVVPCFKDFHTTPGS